MNCNHLLWGIFIFLLVIVIGAGVHSSENFLSEHFGSSCVDFIPFKQVPNHTIKPNTIFVSVASYRDAECSFTLETIFRKAKHPENIFVGVCEQNKKGEQNEVCMSPSVEKFKDNIRVMTLNYTEAKGPTFARYHCVNLWEGEEYFLQIDSHTTFVENWDTDLIEMIHQIKQDPNESNKPVLSVYPPTDKQMKLEGFPEMDNGRLGSNKIPIFLCGWSNPSSVPKRSNKPWAAAGFMFMESSALREVPFDPNLSHLFQGEEILYSARLFTNGYDFYTPNKKVAFHHYGRDDSPIYHKDIKESSGCRAKAEKRVLFLLELGPKSSIAEEFLKDFHYYRLGNFRTLEDFWKASGIDFSKTGDETIERWNETSQPSDKFRGWWFRKDGYENIRKF